MRKKVAVAVLLTWYFTAQVHAQSTWSPPRSPSWNFFQLQPYGTAQQQRQLDARAVARKSGKRAGEWTEMNDDAGNSGAKVERNKQERKFTNATAKRRRKPVKLAVRQTKRSTSPRKIATEQTSRRKKVAGSSPHLSSSSRAAKPATKAAVFGFRDCIASYSAREVGKDKDATWADLLIRAAEGDCRADFDEMGQALSRQFGNDQVEPIMRRLIDTTFLPAAKSAGRTQMPTGAIR